MPGAGMIYSDSFADKSRGTSNTIWPSLPRIFHTIRHTEIDFMLPKWRQRFFRAIRIPFLRGKWHNLIMYWQRVQQCNIAVNPQALRKSLEWYYNKMMSHIMYNNPEWPLHFTGAFLDKHLIQLLYLLHLLHFEHFKNCFMNKCTML